MHIFSNKLELDVYQPTRRLFPAKKTGTAHKVRMKGLQEPFFFFMNGTVLIKDELLR